MIEEQQSQFAFPSWSAMFRDLLMAAGVVAATIAVVGAVILAQQKSIGAPAQPAAGAAQSQEIALLPAQHIRDGQGHVPYNSDPPTSGPHYDSWIQAGFYQGAPPDEYLVHNLEHGYVIIWYNCAALASAECQQLQSQLRDTMQAAGNSPATGTPKLIVVPRPTLSTPIALTTWGRLDRLEAFDRERILTFIGAFRDRAPEGTMP
jgi:Protein of unknown function (DUF3105)